MKDEPHPTGGTVDAGGSCLKAAQLTAKLNAYLDCLSGAPQVQYSWSGCFTKPSVTRANGKHWFQWCQWGKREMNEVPMLPNLAKLASSLSFNGFRGNLLAEVD